MKNAFQCIVCRGDHGKPVLCNCPDYYLGVSVRVDYYRCETCGLVQQSPLPHNTSTFYHQYPIHNPKTSLFDRIRRKILRPVYFDASALPSGSALLDYGCGDGGYLQWVARPALSLMGYEPGASHAVELTARTGIPVYNDLTLLVQDRALSIDIATMHFVLEHLTDPHAAFENVRTILKPGGTLYCVVPHFDSWERRCFGRRWHCLDAPRHISFLHHGAMRRLAGEHGMEIVHDRAVPFPNGVAGSISPVLLGRYVNSLFLLSMPLGIVLSRLAPTGVRAYWLRKTPA